MFGSAGFGEEPETELLLGKPGLTEPLLGKAGFDVEPEVVPLPTLGAKPVSPSPPGSSVSPCWCRSSTVREGVVLGEDELGNGCACQLRVAAGRARGVALASGFAKLELSALPASVGARTSTERAVAARGIALATSGGAPSSLAAP